MPEPMTQVHAASWAPAPLGLTGPYRPRPKRAALPPLVPLTFALLLLSNFVNFKFLGFSFSGWSWVVLLCAALFRLLTHANRVKLPLLIWAPWSALVFAYTFAGYQYAWQSTAQILCPIVVAAAVSTHPFDLGALRKLDRAIRKTYWLLLVGVVVVVIPFSLADIDNSGWATGAISLLFFQAWFLASYFLKGRKTLDLMLYLSAVAVPVIGANRGPMLAGAVLAVCAILPISLSRRLLIAGAAVAIGVFAFYTPKMQKKMFFSGRGTIQDLRPDNPDLHTSGRKPMWDALKSGIADSPVWGHGGNADRTFLLGRRFRHYLPHNDWLRIGFNYGLVGALLYAGTLIAQALHARRYLAPSANPELRTVTGAALTCFVAYSVVMYSDNVLVYCQYFTVPMMILLGVAYSARPPQANSNRRNVRPGGSAPLRTLAR